MKISKESINILKNFASISNNLRIYPGSELATLSPQQNIFAKAAVPDVFPVVFDTKDCLPNALLR